MKTLIENRIAKELTDVNGNVNELSQRVVDYVNNIAITYNRNFHLTLDALTRQAYKQLGIESPAEKALNSETKEAVKSLVSGEKYTLFFLNEWGFPCSQQIRFDSYEIKAYAQYNTSVSIFFKNKGSRAINGKRVFGEKKVFIFKGWVNVKDDMFVKTTTNNKAGLRVSHSRTCFDPQYIQDAFDSVNQKPVVLWGGGWVQ